METVERTIQVSVDPSFWSDKRVLVTGATGIVGSWVTRALLKQGASVVALVRDVDFETEFYRSGMYQQVAVVNGRLEDFSSVERSVSEHEVDTVLHLGAQTIVGAAQRSPLATFEANIRGTYNVLEACRRHSPHVRRVVIASSDKAYGDHGGAAYVESAPMQATHPYDVSKLCGDLIAQTYAHTYELPVAIARCGNIYGGGDLNWSRLVPGTIRSLHFDKQPVLRSDGSYTRDYLYVEDAASSYLTLARSSGRDEVRGEAFNFSGGAPRSVLAVVDAIAELMDKTELRPIILNTARFEIPHQLVSSQKAHDVLGWRPEFDLTGGLRETVGWYCAFFGNRKLPM